MSYRNWCFTSYEENPIPYDEHTMDTLVEQREQCPKTNKLHWQGCIKFRRGHEFTWVKKLLGSTCHIERAHDWNASVKYCTKNETRVPGTQPLLHGNCNTTDWRQCTNQTLWEERPDWMLRNYRGVAAYRATLQQPISRENQRVVVFYGPPGTGKSHSAHKLHPISYTKDSSKWWDGYSDHEHIIWDDFAGTIPFRDFLRICDIYPMRVETKGGYTNLCSKTITITTNKHPRDWYPNQDYECIKRRIHEFWIYEDGYKATLNNLLLL